MRIGKPLSREQAKQGDLIPPGIYPFEVIDASDEVSQKGSDMIKLKLKVFLDDGREKILFDYLLEAMEFKMAHFFDAVGLWDKYEAGEVTADDCFGRSGEVKIYIQKSKDAAYGDKAAVADYMLNDERTAAKTERKALPVKTAVTKDEFEDDLPF